MQGAECRMLSAMMCALAIHLTSLIANHLYGLATALPWLTASAKKRFNGFLCSPLRLFALLLFCWQLLLHALVHRLHEDCIFCFAPLDCTACSSTSVLSLSPEPCTLRTSRGYITTYPVRLLCIFTNARSLTKPAIHCPHQFLSELLVQRLEPQYLCFLLGCLLVFFGQPRPPQLGLAACSVAATDPSSRSRFMT